MFLYNYNWFLFLKSKKLPDSFFLIKLLGIHRKVKNTRQTYKNPTQENTLASRLSNARQYFVAVVTWVLCRTDQQLQDPSPGTGATPGNHSVGGQGFCLIRITSPDHFESGSNLHLDRGVHR